MTETLVNTYTSGGQSLSAVAIDADGNFVVAWISGGQDGSLNGIYAQRFNADLTPAGSEFLVNTFTLNSQTNPAIGMNGDGTFVVTWDSTGQDGSGASVHGQRFDASGVSQGSEFQVNTYTSPAQSLSSVAMDDTGNFVVTWASSGQDGSNYGIYAQRYNAAGVAQGTEFQVNTYTSGLQGTADVAMDADGDFVVVWQSTGQDGNGNGIFAQRYNASGVAQGSEFQVNTYTSGAQSNPDVAMADNGDFLVTWMSGGQDGDSNGIFAQRYNAAGVAQGSEFQVNTYTSGAQHQPTVSMEGDGAFVIAWTSNFQDGIGYGVFAQRYQADGTPIDTEFPVNTHTSGSQNDASVAFSSSGDAVFTWASNSQDGSSLGVYMDTLSSLTCFLRGTLVMTDRGEMPVQALRAGDLVATRFGGLRPIRWIGLQCFDGRLAGPDCQPVRFGPGSLGEGLPHSDLFVSPGHAMLVDQVLVHAGVLVNDVGITRAAMDGMIAYFHLDLGEHDCVQANGAWAESYFEDRNRASFHNAAEFHASFPGHVEVRQDTCLPIVDAVHELAGYVHARLAPRLEAAMLSDDAALHVLCDGRRLEVAAEGGVVRVRVPAGARELRLRSRGTRPNMALGIDDHRRLGVMVHAMSVDTGGLRRDIRLDHPGLARGFHPVEHGHGQIWRWTDGDGVIPAQVLGDGAAARLVSIHCTTMTLNFVGAGQGAPAERMAA